MCMVKMKRECAWLRRSTLLLLLFVDDFIQYVLQNVFIAHQLDAGLWVGQEFVGVCGIEYVQSAFFVDV